MSEAEPSEAEIRSYLEDLRNWDRWGREDQVGALNLIDDDKRRRAAGLVRSGKAVSLSRPFPTEPAVDNPRPALRFLRRLRKPRGAGAVVDFYGVDYHGVASTHIDALCHMWDEAGMWNGKDPDEVISPEGTAWGGIEHWKDGILTRGVLIDIPAARGRDYVEDGRPVHGWEIEEAARAQGVEPEPGDALIVYSGREAWSRAHAVPWGTRRDGLAGLDSRAVDEIVGELDRRPGLHASCLKAIRDWDAAVLVWDMMDAVPQPYDVAFTVHGSIFAYGVALVDNALLEPLAQACRHEGRYEVMLSVNPLHVVGGTGAPVNPVGYL